MRIEEIETYLELGLREAQILATKPVMISLEEQNRLLDDYEREKAVKEFITNAVILDVETTGLNYDDDDEIVSIALVDLEGNVLLDSLVKPTCWIGYGARKAHKITNKMVADAPTIEDLYEKIVDIIEDKYVCIYNYYFFEPIIGNTAKARNLAHPLEFQREGRCIMRDCINHHIDDGYTEFLLLNQAAEAAGVEQQHPALNALNDAMTVRDIMLSWLKTKD